MEYFQSISEIRWDFQDSGRIHNMKKCLLILLLVPLLLSFLGFLSTNLPFQFSSLCFLCSLLSISPNQHFFISSLFYSFLFVFVHFVVHLPSFLLYLPDTLSSQCQIDCGSCFTRNPYFPHTFFVSIVILTSLFSGSFFAPPMETLAKYWITFFVFSVLPAPLSPL